MKSQSPGILLNDHSLRRVAVNCAVDGLFLRREISSLILRDSVDASAHLHNELDRLVLELRAWLLCRDVHVDTLPDEKISSTESSATITLQTPATWFDHLKQTFAEWYGKRFGRRPRWSVRWVGHPLRLYTTYTTVKRTTIVRHVCPHVGIDRYDNRHVLFLYEPSEETSNG